jgi:hypothetical protein
VDGRYDEVSLRALATEIARDIGGYPAGTAELLARELVQALRENNLPPLPGLRLTSHDSRKSWFDRFTPELSIVPPVTEPGVEAEVGVAQVSPWLASLYSQAVLWVQSEEGKWSEGDVLRLFAETCRARDTIRAWRVLGGKVRPRLGEPARGDDVERQRLYQILNDLHALTGQPLHVVWHYVAVPLHAAFLLGKEGDRRAAAQRFLRSLYNLAP